MDKGRHICTHQSESVAFEKVFQVTGNASGEIVETDDFVTFIQETITDVRSEKPSPSGHSSASTFHVSPLPRNGSYPQYLREANRKVLRIRWMMQTPLSTCCADCWLILIVVRGMPECGDVLAVVKAKP